MKTLNLSIATVAIVTLIGCGGGSASSDLTATGGTTGSGANGGSTANGGNTAGGSTTGGSSGGSTTSGGTTTGSTQDPYQTNKVFYGVKQTGQTKSYDKSGNEAANTDDGYYQSGNDINYTRDADKGVVVDYATGYMWQDNEDAKIDTGLLDDAKHYCETLTLGNYTDWRLPTLQELVTIVDMSKHNPAIDVNTFEHIALDFSYIVSDLGKEFDAGGKHYSYGKSVSFSEGNAITTGGYYVRCVRNFGKIPDQTFVRDDASKTVRDLRTKLQWQDTPEVQTAYYSWQEGIAYCEGLDLDGHQDWRMPSFFELYSLFVPTAKNTSTPGIDPAFKNTYRGQYFTSTTNALTPDNANVVNFNNNLAGGIGGAGYSKVPKSQNMHVRCVRSIQ